MMVIVHLVWLTALTAMTVMPDALMRRLNPTLTVNPSRRDLCLFQRSPLLGGESQGRERSAVFANDQWNILKMTRMTMGMTLTR